MLRKLGEFYLIAIALIVAITIVLAGSGLSQTEITMFAMLAWPCSALVMLARRRLARIVATGR
ncbi:hypothetical protein HMH01_01650 [Halovulum dunhuangense]|uniref:Uncharacterized protein n=1 Tax=Halovulum dunhuangense TaxID=1505036 RepID=A0A849KU73_9RHOB|nr:hypothetical protein [Halovulum dunhuangense]NNU79131.1 hypothetical protein [Halovulum dunhuangense]